MLVVGAGSTGGYFGGRLAEAGRDVTFLVRPARAAHLRANGLQIVSPNGDLTLAPKLVTADDVGGLYDAILITVKAYGLAAALDDLAPAVGPTTMILPVLNGMKHVDMITARFGAGALVGCVCKIAATIDAQGRIVQLARFNELAYGEMDGAPSARTERLDAFMRGAGFDARLTPEVEREMWEKWILLATLGGVTTLMRGTIGQIAAAPGGVEFVSRFLDEVLAVVNAVGKPPSTAFVTSTRAALTTQGSSQAPSMYRDLEQGHPIEADQIVGDLLARAARAGIATPLLATSHANPSVYQNRLKAA